MKVIKLPYSTLKPIPSKQWGKCYHKCEKENCPPEKLMEAHLSPEDFHCELWNNGWEKKIEK